MTKDEVVFCRGQHDVWRHLQGDQWEPILDHIQQLEHLAYILADSCCQKLAVATVSLGDQPSMAQVLALL